MVPVAIEELKLEVFDADVSGDSRKQFPVKILDDPSTNLIGRNLEHRLLDGVRMTSRKDVIKPRHCGTAPWGTIGSYLTEADGLVVNPRGDMGYEQGDLVWINDEKLFVSDRPKHLTCYILDNGAPVKVIYSDVLFRPDLILDGKIYTRFGPPLKCGRYRVIVQEPNTITGTHLSAITPEDIMRAQCLASNPALRLRIFRDKLELYAKNFHNVAYNASYSPEPPSSTASPLSSHAMDFGEAFSSESEPDTPDVLYPPYSIDTSGRRSSNPLGSFEQAIRYKLEMARSPRRHTPFTAKADEDTWAISAKSSFTWSSDASAAGPWRGEDEQGYNGFPLLARR